MGWKYPSRLTTAQRDMLRMIERNPFYSPRSTRTKTRLQKLVDRGYIIVNGRTGRKKVNLQCEKQ